LWIGTAKGLYVIERPAADTRAHRIDEMPAAAAASSTPGGCQSPDGTRWFISDAGLVRNKQGSWSLPRIAEFSPAPKLILISCARDNSLWLAGETPGVWHITMDEDVLHAHNILPADDPLNAKRILALQEDRRGWLWLATDSGIVIYDGQLWRLFDQDSGLVWNDCNQSALWEDTDGSIWIGTSRGLSHVMQPETLFSNSPLQARVIGISRGAESLSASTDFSLPWSDLPLVFKLAIPFYTDPHHLFFRYRLDGLEKEWVTTAQDELRYPALAGGDYHLEIVAEDAALRTHSPVTEIHFHIDSPWWLSWPFFVFSALVLASLSMLMYSWRIRNLRSRQHELEALVADRTRELEASKQQYLMLASRDGLTGLWNRRAIMELLDIAVEHSRINRLPLTVALVDLDYFKRVNDSHGHGSGDTVLCEAARRFQEGLDGKGSVGRYGGEEFLVIVPDLNLQEGVERVRHLHQGLSAKPIALDDGREIIVTCSIGLVFSDGFRHSPTFLVKLADQALYQAKDQGRNRSVFTDARALPAARSIFESGADT
jgi:diguanylate cyclase (GGDEF)-like protein